MFIRRKVVGSWTYYQVIEGYRDGDGKVKHRHIVSLGKTPTVPEALQAVEQECRRQIARVARERRLTTEEATPQRRLQLRRAEEALARVQERYAILKRLNQTATDHPAPQEPLNSRRTRSAALVSRPDRVRSVPDRGSPGSRGGD